MYKHLTKISTVGMSREDWLTERRKSLGGSDVASILGMNEYSSPYAVWADKLGKLPDKEDNEAMRLGRDLEDYVAQRFTEKTGKKVRRENAILRNPDMPYLHANVDRVVVGENAVLECKTVSALNLSKYKNGEYPARFYAQCCEYMLVCGFEKAYLAVLVLGKEFLVFEIERDENELAALKGACEEFWHYVETKTPPPVDGLEASSNAITALYPESSETTIDLFPIGNTLMAYNAVCAQIKTLEADKEALANEVKAYMKEAQGGENDKFRVSWKSSTRQTFDSKAFAKDHPNMSLAKYYKTTNVRTFKVTQK